MSQQSMIDAAKAPILAYGDKDWNKVMIRLRPASCTTKWLLI